MSELEPPYYLSGTDENVFTDLELQLSIIPPQLRERYRSLETVVSSAFIERYGIYLNDDQKNYLRGTRTIFTDHDTAEQFGNVWDEGILSIDVHDAVLKGFIYTEYSVGEYGEKTITQTPGGSTARQHWGGRLAVFPLGREEVAEVGPEWLMDQQAYDAFTDTMGVAETLASIEPFVYSNTIGGAVLHEKLHGVQDYRLPLPILEAAAHYYQRELFREKGWDVDIKSNMNAFADYYGTCVEELGEDLHRLIFGMIEEDKREVLLQQLKDRFTPRKIEELSKQKSKLFPKRTDDWIYWKRQRARAVKREIAAIKNRKA